MIDWHSVAVVFSIYLAGVVIPGPNFVAVINVAVSAGRRPALALVAGIVLVNLFWAASALLGMGAVFKLFPWLAMVAKLAGAAYLIWFGVCLLITQQKGVGVMIVSLDKLGLMRAFKTGITVNIANPKSIAFYAAVFSAAAPSALNVPTLMLMLTTVLIIASAWYGAVAMLLSSATVSAAFLRLKHWFNRVCGSALIVLGLKQAFTKE